MSIFSKGWFIALLMVVGMVVLGFGLDFDQTQVAWKVPLATPFIVTGSVMFGLGVILLFTNTRSGG